MEHLGCFPSDSDGNIRPSEGKIELQVDCFYAYVFAHVYTNYNQKAGSGFKMSKMLHLIEFITILTMNGRKMQ